MDFAAERAEMVERQLAARDIDDPAVLKAMGAVPRECFVPDHLAARAYDDGPLPIGLEQTISQPYIVALMAQAAAIGLGDRILEVGAGSGYAASVFGQIVARVFAVERHESLAASARARIEALGYDNVSIRHGDGSAGLPTEAPFDAILVAAGAAEIPERLREQLADDGRLVIPVGRQNRQQRLVRLIRHGDDFNRDEFGGVSFVPLVSRCDASTERTNR